ncbi:ankyrin repeat domain-containing protein [Pontibacter cellulosilyticus]|uniref:Ankyrin repeat domain-containing protein n=1 Tax=Pontibacter cellulosilyticus TaxID=1720253 RepID=A0A923N8U0_9BACT|nr:ankyrin repeat domain-containing protein [Pontibacter cellulosilyticus]MBC5994341.1 ankyrin repeat domain-containing protein [Pontibacter cellulosilyticus]
MNLLLAVLFILTGNMAMAQSKATQKNTPAKGKTTTTTVVTKKPAATTAGASKTASAKPATSPAVQKQGGTAVTTTKSAAPALVVKKVWRTAAMDSAMAYYTTLRFQEAYSKFKAAVNQGDNDALYFIGRMHQYRELKYDSVQIDTLEQIQNAEKYFSAKKDSAKFYYQRAVDEGSLLGHLGLAEQTILRSLEDKQRFIQHMRTAAIVIREKAVEGDAFANRILGSMYYTGFGEMKDYSLAFNYLNRAANANDVVAYTSLANLYLNGEGVKKDLDKAAYWLKRGVTANEREAFYTLALLHEEGTLGEVNIDEARTLYRRAIEKGSVSAYEQLMYINQTPDQKVVIASVNRDPDMLKRALAAGGDPNTQAVPDDFEAVLDGRTALMHTVYIPMLLEDYGVIYEPEVRLKMVSLLLEKGADINAQDSVGKTALHYVVSSSRIRSELYEQEQADLLDTLLAKGANPNIKDKEGNTALAQALKATIGQHIGIMELEKLLKAGADPNIQNSESKTPLMLACEMNANFEIILALLQSGADAKIKDSAGKAAIDYTKHENVQNILMAAGSPEKQ